MGKTLVADTNVYYYLSRGVLSKSDIVVSGETLHFSPISVMELAGKLSDLTFEERKNVAQSILDTRARLLLDPESFLTRLFGLELAEKPFDWIQAVKAMSQAQNLKQLEIAVPDYSDAVVRHMKVGVATSWRQQTDKQWMSDTLSIMDEQIPAFKKWYDPDPKKRRGNKPRMRGQQKRDFLNSTTSTEWFSTLIATCQQKAFHCAKKPARFVPTRQHAAQLAKAANGVHCYCSVYTQYLISLITEGMLPQPNDRGDLDLFTYATTDNDMVITAEKRWANLAKRAGYENRVRKVVPRATP